MGAVFEGMSGDNMVGLMEYDYKVCPKRSALTRHNLEVSACAPAHTQLFHFHFHRKNHTKKMGKSFVVMNHAERPRPVEQDARKPFCWFLIR